MARDCGALELELQEGSPNAVLSEISEEDDTPVQQLQPARTWKSKLAAATICVMLALTGASALAQRSAAPAAPAAPAAASLAKEMGDDSTISTVSSFSGDDTEVPYSDWSGGPSKATESLAAERFCISDDTCVDYDGSDYTCVAGKCVPMGGQPSAIEPEKLGSTPGSTKTSGSTPGKKKGTLKTRLAGSTATTEEGDDSTISTVSSFTGDDTEVPYSDWSGGPSKATKSLAAERFCISDDTCVDYDGSDYTCVAGKCVPMGGQPSAITPEQLGSTPGSTKTSGSTPGKKKGTLKTRLAGSTATTEEGDDSTISTVSSFTGDDTEVPYSDWSGGPSKAKSN